ncbi:MAG: sigma-54 dependent transcriptional regulator [Deltaproteobacteria bacterium]|nr:sigma-54 dependent transcriptional regulator [Deltaproteobacteria bacterium]MCL5792104.1 sigma-54 dependent transcriptional regulator [Deltaproteobacteria bacterium]
MQLVRIAVIEDDNTQRKVIEFNLSREGYNVKGAGTISEGFKLIKEQNPAIVITDVMLPDGDGVELLGKIISANPSTIVIVITAYGTIRMAVDAIRKGAYNYITKPYEMDELLLSIRQALSSMETRQHTLKDAVQLIGSSEPIQKIKQMIEQVKDSDIPVLITGESGTGKEIMARLIHFTSSRKDKHFVALNCAAIPASLLEAELFGYVKGAFSGADKAKPGRFQIADGGTLFLDEIGSMDVALQSKLLRVVETGEIEMLGEVEAKKVNVRIISATNADLNDLIIRGIFREDLYYRLNVFNIHVPPLRERKQDITMLMNHFINLYSEDKTLSIANKAIDMLINYQWYGNVRELENFIRRMAVTKKHGVITDEDISPYLKSNISSLKQDSSLDEVEKQMILSALEKSGHNKAMAAEILKIPRHKLIYRIKKFGIHE